MHVVRFLFKRLETHFVLWITFGSIVVNINQGVDKLTPWLLGVPIGSTFIALLFMHFSREIFPAKWESVHYLINGLQPRVQIPVISSVALLLLCVTAITGYLLIQQAWGRMSFWPGAILFSAVEIVVNWLSLKGVEVFLMIMAHKSKYTDEPNSTGGTV